MTITQTKINSKEKTLMQQILKQKNVYIWFGHLKVMSHIFSMGRVPGSIFSKYDGMVLGCENGLPALNFKIKKKIAVYQCQKKNKGFPGGSVAPSAKGETWVRSLIREDTTRCRATKPVPQLFSLCPGAWEPQLLSPSILKSVLHNERADPLSESRERPTQQ